MNSTTMPESRSHSWADIVAHSQASQPRLNERMEFRWKTVKKGRLKVSAAKPVNQCDANHCQASEAPCVRKQCIARIERELTVVQSENIALDAAFEVRLRDLDHLRQEIYENCKMEDFFTVEMDESRLAVINAKKKKTQLALCECSSCQLRFHQNEAALFNERLSAAQHRLKMLREFRVANDKETTHPTSSHFNKENKYFTPVGSTKAKGVSALKPTLRMQSSYDVAALTTNSMVARPLKTAWKDKPKPIRIVSASPGTKQTLRN